MKNFAAGLVIALAGISTAAGAATYQSEAFGSYGDLEGNTVYDLKGTFYFTPVSTIDYPLQEAAFLQRTSNLRLSYTRFEDDLSVSRISINQFLFGSRFYLAGHFHKIDFHNGNSDNEWGASIGFAPFSGLLVYTNYRFAPILTGSVFGSLLTLLPTSEPYEPNLNVKYVQSLSNGSSFKLEGSFAKRDLWDYQYMGGDYFVDSTFSVGGWLEDHELFGDGHGVRVEKFFSSNTSLHGNYTRWSESDIWQVGFRFRF